MVLPTAAMGGPRNEELYRKLSASDARYLESLRAVSVESLREIAAVTDPERLNKAAAEIMSLGLCIGSRRVGEDGRPLIHTYIRRRVEALKPQGVEYIGSLIGEVAAPVAVDRSDQRDKHEGWNEGSRITVEGGAPVRLLPLWPNGAMPSLCPVGGLSGPLVYTRRAEWGDLKGLKLKDAIALMDFEGARNWERLAGLGCQAVVVVEDEHITRDRAERLFCHTPVPFARFYVGREAGRKLIEEATRKVHTDGRPTIVTGKSCLLQGGNIYENRPFESIFAYVPPTAPAVYVVKPDDLISRIATEYGVSAEDLARVNKLTGGASPAAGTVLRIPKSTATYTVRKDDLLYRIALQYGVSEWEIIDANDLTGPLEPGRELTIPNLDGAIMVLIPIDAVSVVPDAPHGAQAAANVAFGLAAMDHLARSRACVRRKGIVFAFLDAETLGGMSSRRLAEYVLLSEGKLIEDREKGSISWRTALYGAIGLLVGAALHMLLSYAAARRKAEGPVTFGLEHIALRTKRLPILAAVGVFLFLFPHLLVVYAGYRWDERPTPGRYQASRAWFASPQQAGLDEDTARWLVEEWLEVRYEKQRVAIAEEMNRLRKVRSESEDEAEWQRVQERLDHLEDHLVRQLVELSSDTLHNRSLRWSQRAERFLAAIPQTEQEAQKREFPLLARPFLMRRLEAETAEALKQQHIHENNLNLVKQLLAKLHEDPTKRKPVLGWQLALTDGSISMGMDPAVPKKFRGKGFPGAINPSVRFQNVLAFASVQAGWKEDWPILRKQDKVHQFVMDVLGPAMYSEFWAVADVSVLPLYTRNDTTDKLDTPLDVIENTNLRNLSVQARNVLVMVKTGLESAVDSMAKEQIRADKMGRLVGKVTQFNVRSGIDARDPVPGTYVYYPGIKKEHGETPYNTSTFRGSRRGIVLISPLSGRYSLPPELLSYNQKRVIYAYHLDPETALFDKVADQGQIGTQKKDPKFKLLEDRDTEKDLIMTDVYPFVIFAGPDPRDYQVIGGTKGAKDVLLSDVDLKGEPRHFAIDRAGEDYKEQDIDAIVIYGEPGRRLRIAARQNITFKMLLVGHVNPDDPEHKGDGYLIGPRGDDRNVFLAMTSRHVAKDFLALSRRQRELYEKYGITDQAVNESVRRAGEKYRRSVRAHADNDYQLANGSARECWGMLGKSYGRILQLGRESVFSVVILMALLLPASVFLEKLVIGSKAILARLIGTTVIFVLGAVFLNYFHPAFEIAISPFIVMIAFTMILMSLIVLVISYQRFEVLVRRARAAGGEVEAEEISLTSSLATAMSLGVSNLKKRPARTFLTVFTVTVLTFSIVTFVSVKGRDEVDLRTVVLDADVEGRIVDPEPPKYNGVLFREFYWLKMDSGFVSAIRSEFGSRYDVTVRGHYIEQEGGNNADREGVNQVKVQYPAKDKSFILMGIMGFEPNEVDFSRLHEAVSHRQWFRDEDRRKGVAKDRCVVILPDNAAKALGITPADLYDLRITPGDVADWQALCSLLQRAGQDNPPSPARRLWTLLPEQVQAQVRRIAAGAAPQDAAVKAILAAINQVIAGRRDFHRPEDYRRLEAGGRVVRPAIEIPEGARAFMAAGRGGEPEDVPVLRDKLSDKELSWVNGTLVEAALGPALAPDRPVRRPESQLPVVDMMGNPWHVIGILDVERAERIRDVNGKSLAMVDYLRSAFAHGAAGGGDLANEQSSYHVSWDKLVIIPMAAKDDVQQFKYRAVAIRFREPKTVEVEKGDTLESLAGRHLGSAERADEIARANADRITADQPLPVGMELQIPGDDMKEFRRDVALRINKSMFGQVDGRLSLVTTRTKSSVGGLAKIVVPVILCVLIVLNTMLANVEERRGEVGMLGAIGLSPSQISFLLLSESAVFSVLGIVLGTFAGLLFAKVVQWVHATDPEFLAGLSFNFTSLASMALATATGVVVLLATLIPARKAAALAAPSGMANWELPEPSDDGRIRFELPFTLTRGNAVGMMTFFRQFLLNHADPVSPDFNCRDVSLAVQSDDADALVITARMWLSPYDLDVAQEFHLRAVPTENEGVFGVVILLHRTSGTEDAWLRTNYGFMDLVRHQFLLWRNLDNDARMDYISQGARLFQEASR
jgi:LysM repeat protein/nucleoid-associated protein YgaU